jgi:hypothetical protein
MAEEITRRDAIKRLAYATPAILTLAAIPAFARSGSCDTERYDRNDNDNEDENEQT